MRKISFFLALILSFIWIKITMLVSAAPSPNSGDTAANYNSGDVIALILYITIAISFSFMCSIAEAVLLNITPSYIADLQDKNPKLAEKVIYIRQTNIDQSLAGILTMNTIAHTVGAIGSGAKATIVFGSVWFGLFSAVMTLMILFLSEIIPKTVGVVWWRQLIRPVVKYIQILTFALYPMIWISDVVTKLIAKDHPIHQFNRDEFVAMANVGMASGALNDRESRIIKNLFKLGSLTVKDVYTPRTVMMAFDQNLTVSDVYDVQDKISFSRLLIYDGDLDNITGFILKDEILLLESQEKGKTKISTLCRDIIAVPIQTSLSKLLEMFLQKKHHIALVVDEFGTKGLITVEDVLETLLGIEIVDESDRVTDMQELAKELWRKRMESFGLDLTAVEGSEDLTETDTKSEG